jgi:hypothetical protein
MTTGKLSYFALFNRLYGALPAFMAWMHQLLDGYRDRSLALDDFKYKKVTIVFPPVLRSQTKIVQVAEKVPMPPIEELGLGQLLEVNPEKTLGITYQNVIFLQEGHCNEINCFHEMIHRVQWQRLGIERFLMAYGMHLALHGYEENPLEQSAYTFQHKLESNVLPMNFLDTVKAQADLAWADINPLKHSADVIDPLSI